MLRLNQYIQKLGFVEHLDRIEELKSNIVHLGWYPFWREVGAYYWTAPRQSGKSFLLREIKEELGDEAVLGIATGPSTDGVQLRKENCFRGYTVNNKILLVDEYDFLTTERLAEALEHPWKGVFMAGSKRER